MRPLSTTVRAGLFACLVGAVRATALDAQPGQSALTFALSTDSIAVGAPFVLTVRAQLPAGARLIWPQLTDTAAAVVMRRPPQEIVEGTRFGRTSIRAEYDLTAWAVGTLPIGLGELRVLRDGREERLSLAEAVVTVRSVLTGDTATHRPRPPRELFPRLVPWWRRWWPAVALLCVLAFLGYLRRRHVMPKASMVMTGGDPYREAMQAFNRIAQLRLIDAGEGGRAAILAQDAVRYYLAERIPAANRSLTSAELLVAIAEDDRIPRDALLSLLAEVDRLKFAAHPVTSQHVGQLLTKSRSLVEAIEQAEQARRRAMEEAERAAAAAAARERAADEDRARRASRHRGKTS